MRRFRLPSVFAFIARAFYIIVLLAFGCRPTAPGVYVFLAPDCPLSQNYTLPLNELFAEFKNVEFRGVIAGNFPRTEIDAFVAEYGVKFPVVADPKFELADSLEATKTPEAFVIGPDGTTLYKGAIDNWAVALGQHRQVTTEHYLRDVLSGRRDAPKETPAVGCFIERKN